MIPEPRLPSSRLPASRQDQQLFSIELLVLRRLRHPRRWRRDARRPDFFLNLRGGFALRGQGGFAYAELIIAVVIVGTALAGLAGAMSSGFAQIGVASRFSVA